MNNQQIELNKVRYKDYISKPEYKTNPRDMYRAGVKSLTVINNEKLTENLVNHAGLKKAQIMAVLNALPLAVRDYCEAGDAVQILNLCTFKPCIKSRAVSLEELCNATTIVSRKIRVYPIGETAEVIKSWNFTMGKDIVNGKMDDEDGSVDPGENNQPGGNQQGGQQPSQPTEYNLTFLKADGTVISSERLSAGATITYPANTSGYQWPTSKPATMPAQNTTVQEVLIPQTGSNATLRWVKEDMTVAKEMQVAVGSTIAQSDIPANTDRDHYWGKSLTQINEWLAAATAGQTLEIDEYDERF